MFVSVRATKKNIISAFFHQLNFKRQKVFLSIKKKYLLYFLTVYVITF